MNGTKDQLVQIDTCQPLTLPMSSQETHGGGGGRATDGTAAGTARPDTYGDPLSGLQMY